MSNQTDFKEREKKILDFWKKEKIYKFDFKNKKKVYSIDTPPPYISGKMHIGHAFMYSQMDFIARFMRMKEGDVFYPFGTDDNGLPTERFVEKTNNIKSSDMPRSEFIELCLKTLKDTTFEFVQDWVDLGISCDWDNLMYSTIDDNSRKISQKSFIDLYKKGDIYKNNFPTLWCPDCQTAIAQAELEDKETPSLFSTLKFSCEGKDLLIATTRPELLPACVAVFINPQDKKRKNLIGKKAIVPLFDFEVPIIADESAQIDKGTGVLMVCSYGDKYDAEAIAKHKLTSKTIIDKNGKINSTNYKRLNIKEARKKILEDLKNKNLIESQENIHHIVNVHDKCGTPIEILETEQWFTKILDKKKKLVEQGKKVNWYPEFMFKRYENWVKGLQWDWNISRNRHFGVSIPVWECKDCNEIILPNEKELPVDPLETEKICPKCKKKAEGESMVLDTWATSSLSPNIASSLVDNKIEIPYSLRPQGHDIIRTWAFYTIVKSYLHEEKIPWNDMIVTGNVSLGGEKMSKSKGNVITPQDVLEKFSADALRFWAAGSKLGGDLDYHEKDLITGEKLVKKILNSSKFVFMNLKDYKPKKTELLETDKIFLKNLNLLVSKVTKSFEEYEYSKAKMETDNFFWKHFCDNYLEIVKNRVYNGTKKEKESAYYTLYHSLLTLLKLFAPLVPFITEEIYQDYFRKNEKDKSIHISSWPEEFKIKSEKNDAKIFNLMLDTISKVRQEKSQAKKSMKAEIILTIDKKDKGSLKDVLDDLKAVTNSKEIKEGKFNVEFVE